MAQSFLSGGGMLSAISIIVAGTQSQSTSSLYELSIFSGTPSPTCGYSVATTATCAFSDFGDPLATALDSIKNAGVNKLFFHKPVYLTAGQIYTFSITPTTNNQNFDWRITTSSYGSGNSFGINGNISVVDDDCIFQTHYLPPG